MKKRYLAAATLVLMSGLAPAAVFTVGSGDGSLSVDVNPTGYVLGDTGTFDAGANSGNTIWKLYFGITEGTDTIFVDAEASTTPDIEAGSPTIEFSGISNLNRNLTPISNMTVNLTTFLAQPVYGLNANLAELTFHWVFSNFTPSPRPMNITAWLDTDAYVDGTFNDNVIAFASGAVNGYFIQNPVGAIAMSNGPGAVNLDEGILFDVERPFANPGDIRLLGISNSSGASDWWTSTAPYATTGYSVNRKVPASLANTIEGDADNNYLIDTGGDIGGAISVDFSAQQNSDTTIVFRLLYGLDTTVDGSTFTSAIDSWEMYDN